MSGASPSLTRARLESLLNGMRGRRIVVLGDAMLDRYLAGDAERISPEAPVPVVRVTGQHTALGGAANVAANLAALGSEARLVAVVGKDRDAATLRAGLGALGMSDAHVLEVADRPTTVKTRVTARGQPVVRIDEETDDPVDGATAQRLRAALEAALDGAYALVLEDYDKGVLVRDLIRDAIGAARGRGMPVVADPKYRGFFDYAGATVFKPNRRELATALGAAVDARSADALPAARARLQVEHLLVTLGGEGMLLVSANGSPVHLPAARREVFDVSGAGDTVAAWLAAGLAAGATVLEAAQLANTAAGVEVGKAGIRTVSPAEVLAHHPRQ